MKKTTSILLIPIITLLLCSLTFATDNVNEKAWQQDENGWHYYNIDGTEASDEWVQEGGSWYHFDKAGYMQTGWIFTDDHWYYLYPSGVMATGWLTLDENRYYLSGAGIMHTGWLESEGNWYYFDDQGVLQTGELLINGARYIMDDSGKLTEGPYPIDSPDDFQNSVYAKIGIPLDREFTTYVFSITGNPEDLTMEPDGIFCEENVWNRGRDNERPVHVDAWDPEGNLIISQDAGIRAYGGMSRFNYLKSVKLFARAEYDAENKNFKYCFFNTPKEDGSGDLIKKYKKIILRNSGTDYMLAWIRDELCQMLAKDAGFSDYEACVPAVYYLNGEYKGFYWLHEAYCDNYFKNKYADDRKEGEFIIIDGDELHKRIDSDDETKSAAADEFNENYEYFLTLDYTDDSSFESLNEYIDVENYLMYYAYNIYICNHDWPSNNVKCYRYYAADSSEYENGTVYDGRWRFLLHDMDLSMGIYGQDIYLASYDNLYEVLTEYILDDNGEEIENERYSPLFAALMKRPSCRDFFVNYSIELSKGALSVDFVTKVLNSMNEERAEEMDYFCDYLEKLMYQGVDGVWACKGFYLDYAQDIIRFMKERPTYAIQYMEDDLSAFVENANGE